MTIKTYAFIYTILCIISAITFFSSLLIFAYYPTNTVAWIIIGSNITGITFAFLGKIYLNKLK